MYLRCRDVSDMQRCTKNIVRMAEMNYSYCTRYDSLPRHITNKNTLPVCYSYNLYFPATCKCSFNKTNQFRLTNYRQSNGFSTFSSMENTCRHRVVCIFPITRTVLFLSITFQSMSLQTYTSETSVNVAFTNFRTEMGDASLEN